MKSKILVSMQFFAIFLMTLPFGTPSDYLYLGLVIIALGGVIGILALKANTIGNFNIRPDIKESATLVTQGIYAYIRHPMYTSVLVMMLGVLILYPIELEFISYAVLLLVLLLKLFYEESLWQAQSREYREYMKKSRRLIPFIF